MASEVGAIGAAEDGGTGSYAASWVNVVNRWFERLPGPTWLAYLGAMTGGVALSTAARIVDPTAPLEDVALVYYGALPFAALGLIHSLDRTAGRALVALRPLLQMTDEAVADTRRRLTVVPARPAALLALLSFVITPIGYVMDPVGSGIVGYSPVGLAFRYAWEGLITSVFLTLVYHTIRQLRLIGRLHEDIGRIDVFDQTPLYALSWLTSRTAAGLILLLVPSVFLIPQGADVSYLALSAFWYSLALLMAAAAFFLPLRGVHERLASEKRRLQGEVGRRLTTTLEGIQAAVDAEDGAAIEMRHRALATLIAERDLTNRIPTWPWSTGALTGFVSAVLLPIGLWAATRLLERFV